MRPFSAAMALSLDAMVLAMCGLGRTGLDATALACADLRQCALRGWVLLVQLVDITVTALHLPAFYPPSAAPDLNGAWLQLAAIASACGPGGGTHNCGGNSALSRCSS